MKTIANVTIPKDPDPTPDESIPTLFVLEAIYLASKVDGKSILGKFNDRKLHKSIYEICLFLDDTIDELLKDHPEAKNEINRYKSVLIDEAQDIAGSFDDKIDALDEVVDAIDFSGLVSPGVATAVDLYRSSAKNPIDCLILLAKFNRLPLRIYEVYLAKMLLKNVYESKPNLWDKLVKSKGIRSDDASELLLLIQPPKKYKKEILDDPKKARRHYTYYEPHYKLLKPLLTNHGPDETDTAFILYNDEFDYNNPADTYYCVQRHPDTGVWGHIYTVEYDEKRKERAIAGGKKLAESYTSVMKNVRKYLQSGKPKEKVCALVVWFVDKKPFRIGNSDSQKDNVYGIHNLEIRHVKKFNKSSITFRFIGKAQMLWEDTVPITNKVHQMLKQLMKNKTSRDRLFTYKNTKGENVPVSDKMVNSFLERKCGSPTKIHKFRRLKANKLMLEKLKELRKSDINANSKKADRNKAKKAVLEEVAELIGDTVSTAKSAYIDPSILNALDAYLKLGKYEVKKRGSKRKSRKSSKKVTSAVIKMKKGDRLIVYSKRLQGIFVGTIDKKLKGELYITLDNGEKISVKENSKYVLAKAKGWKVKKQLQPEEIDKLADGKVLKPNLVKKLADEEKAAEEERMKKADERAERQAIERLKLKEKSGIDYFAVKKFKEKTGVKKMMKTIQNFLGGKRLSNVPKVLEQNKMLISTGRSGKIAGTVKLGFNILPEDEKYDCCISLFYGPKKEHGFKACYIKERWIVHPDSARGMVAHWIKGVAIGKDKELLSVRDSVLVNAMQKLFDHVSEKAGQTMNEQKILKDIEKTLNRAGIGARVAAKADGDFVSYSGFTRASSIYSLTMHSNKYDIEKLAERYRVPFDKNRAEWDKDYEFDIKDEIVHHFIDPIEVLEDNGWKSQSSMIWDDEGNFVDDPEWDLKETKDLPLGPGYYEGPKSRFQHSEKRYETLVKGNVMILIQYSDSHPFSPGGKIMIKGFKAT